MRFPPPIEPPLRSVRPLIPPPPIVSSDPCSSHSSSLLPPISRPLSFHNRPAESFFHPVPLTVSRKLTTYLPPLSSGKTMASPPILPPSSSSRPLPTTLHPRPLPIPPSFPLPKSPIHFSPTSNILNSQPPTTTPDVQGTLSSNSTPSSRSPPTDDVLCLPPSPELDRRILKLRNKLSGSQHLPDVLYDLRRRRVGVEIASKNILFPRRASTSTALPLLFGYPHNDSDLDYCLEDVPGLCADNFTRLRDALILALYNVRHAVYQACSRLEHLLVEQCTFNTLSVQSVNESFAAVVCLYLRARRTILIKFREYVRTRRWIENVATRQRKGCLTHHQNNRMRMWLFSNFHQPYPSADEKRTLCNETGLDLLQVNNWMINARSRFWKPLDEILTGSQVRKKLVNMQNEAAEVTLDGGEGYVGEGNVWNTYASANVQEGGIGSSNMYGTVSGMCAGDGSNRIEQLLSNDREGCDDDGAGVMFSSGVETHGNGMGVDAWLSQTGWDGEDLLEKTEGMGTGTPTSTLDVDTIARGG